MAGSVTEDDIVRAVKQLKVFGAGFTMVQVGSAKYVRSVPGELNLDKNRIIELAQVRGWHCLQVSWL